MLVKSQFLCDGRAVGAIRLTVSLPTSIEARRRAGRAAAVPYIALPVPAGAPAVASSSNEWQPLYPPGVAAEPDGPTRQTVPGIRLN